MRDATVRDAVRKSGKSSKPREFWRTDLMNNKKTKDFYYLQLQNVNEFYYSDDEEQMKKYYKCLTSAKVYRVKNDDTKIEKDYTKCVAYKACKKEPNWSCGWSCPTTTSEPTPETTPESTPEPTPESTPEPTLIPPADPSLPDYNNLDYTFTCEDSDEVENKFQKCTLSVQSPPMTFYGRAKNGYVHFAPIPYAEPPIEDLRWKAPVLKTSYDAPVEGHLGGNDQNGNQLMCSQPKGGQEDCLYLNIEVRQEVLEKKQKIPILYYIHGGGFTSGSGMGTTGKSAENQGVVAIGVNYRLGSWGFLYLNEKEDDQDWQGNWGLLDQQAGLKWIHAFAGLFGGDRDQVTLTGGSAGSESCWRQFTIPSSWPYFHRMAPAGIGLLTGQKSPHKIQV